MAISSKNYGSIRFTTAHKLTADQVGAAVHHRACCVTTRLHIRAGTCSNREDAARHASKGTPNCTVRYLLRTQLLLVSRPSFLGLALQPTVSRLVALCRFALLCSCVRRSAQHCVQSMFDAAGCQSSEATNAFKSRNRQNVVQPLRLLVIFGV